MLFIGIKTMLFIDDAQRRSMLWIIAVVAWVTFVVAIEPFHGAASMGAFFAFSIGNLTSMSTRYKNARNLTLCFITAIGLLMLYLSTGAVQMYEQFGGPAPVLASTGELGFVIVVAIASQLFGCIIGQRIGSRKA